MMARDVVSSMISRIAYDEDQKVLYVEFSAKNKSRPSHYEYLGVGTQQVQELLSSESIGKYFLATIRGGYECHQIDAQKFESLFEQLCVSFVIDWDRIVDLVDFS